MESIDKDIFSKPAMTGQPTEQTRDSYKVKQYKGQNIVYVGKHNVPILKSALEHKVEINGVEHQMPVVAEEFIKLPDNFKAEKAAVTYDYKNKKFIITPILTIPTITPPLPLTPTAEQIPLPRDMPPAPTVEGEKIAKKAMREVDWTKVDFISVPTAKHIPDILHDYYTYDENLQEKDKPSSFLVGMPGIGKSVSVWEAAKKIAESKGRRIYPYTPELGFDLLTSSPESDLRKDAFVFVDLRLTEIEPQDLAGLPDKAEVKGKKYMEYLTPVWAQVLSENPGVLFLDELTNVKRQDVISAAFKILLDKKVGFTKFNNEVMVVAAGNPAGYGIAEELPAALINRMINLEVETPTLDAWAEWMDGKYKDAWDKRIFAYLSRKEFQEDFLDPPKEGMTTKNFPTPRAWTKVATMLPYTKPEYAELLVKGSVGEKVAMKFLSFLKNKPPEIDTLVKNPEKWRELNLDTKWLALVGLSTFYKDIVDKKETEKLMKTLDLIKIIGSESAEYLAALKTMLGEEALKKSIVILSKEKGVEGLTAITKSFAGLTGMKALIEEMIKKG